MKKIIGLCLLMTSVLFAEDTELVTHTELGYVQTSGNTDTTTANVDAMVKKSIGNNIFQLDFDYIYGEQEDIETNNKLDTQFNYDYKFEESFSFNYLTGYKDDKFSGFDYQLYTGPGVKAYILKGPTHILNLQSNILYSKDVSSSKYYNDVNKTDETSYPYAAGQGIVKTGKSTKEYAAFYIKGDYEWNITETFKFTQMISYRLDVQDSDIYFISSKTGIASKISDIFSMGINYKVDYVNTAPEGNVRTDKVFTASIIIDY